MNLTGIRGDHLPGKRIDPTAAAGGSLRAFLQDAESVRVMPMAAELPAARCMRAVDPARRAAEHTDNMRGSTHAAQCIRQPRYTGAPRNATTVGSGGPEASARGHGQSTRR